MRIRQRLPRTVALLEIIDLRLEFVTGREARPVVDGLSLQIEPGQTLCLVGESGCGKTVTALSIARLLPEPPARYTGGRILLEGRDVLEMEAKALRRIRGGVVGYVFQEPGASLNPVWRIGRQILEAVELHRPEQASRSEVIRLLKLVGIPAPESRIDDYPFQLSGGMQQRVMLAMALAAQPKLLVADEPTTALDVTIQAQILELLRELQQRLEMAILLITHNLAVVGEMAGRVAVMYAGQIVESAAPAALLAEPLHPYTRALLNSIPKLQQPAARLTPIPGAIPSSAALLPGCRFAPRCPIAQSACTTTMPKLIEAEPARSVRCPFWAQKSQVPLLLP